MIGGFQVGAFQTNFQQISGAQVQPANSGGWEYWIHHRKRQERLRREEEERQEQIEAQRLAVEKAKSRLAQEQATKAAEALRRTQRTKVLAQLTARVSAQQEELNRLTEHLDALLVLAYLEREMIHVKRKRRNATIMVLLLDAA